MFNAPGQPGVLNPKRRPPAISSSNPPQVNPLPMQVVREQKILGPTMETNVRYWNLPQIKGTVWENYMLVATQWPTNIAPEQPSNGGSPFPTTGSEVANTTMETYFQASGFTCMECHQISNATGRDFVMFVTMDAARPDTLAVAEAFSARLSASKALTSLPLSSDPMMKTYRASSRPRNTSDCEKSVQARTVDSGNCGLRKLAPQISACALSNAHTSSNPISRFISAKE